MKHALAFKAVGHATSLFFAITFLLCVAVTLVFPSHQMAQTLQELLPGFQWLNWKSFFLGLVESYSYGWYATLIWVPLYNVFAARGKD